MEDTDLSWRKSSYSGNGGATCVEVANADRVSSATPWTVPARCSGSVLPRGDGLPAR